MENNKTIETLEKENQLLKDQLNKYKVKLEKISTLLKEINRQHAKRIKECRKLFAKVKEYKQQNKNIKKLI